MAAARPECWIFSTRQVELLMIRNKSEHATFKFVYYANPLRSTTNMEGWILLSERLMAPSAPKRCPSLLACVENPIRSAVHLHPTFMPPPPKHILATAVTPRKKMDSTQVAALCRMSTEEKAQSHRKSSASYYMRVQMAQKQAQAKKASLDKRRPDPLKKPKTRMPTDRKSKTLTEIDAESETETETDSTRSDTGGGNIFEVPRLLSPPKSASDTADEKHISMELTGMSRGSSTSTGDEMMFQAAQKKYSKSRAQLVLARVIALNSGPLTKPSMREAVVWACEDNDFKGLYLHGRVQYSVKLWRLKTYSALHKANLTPYEQAFI
ncbi:hypothetical protein C8J57DRAFT_1246522 [Mycena rebaudengoi]|nr:hypothetical protein C8J57DRAFT_1246522 [Mycena rebaudengoi]